MWCYKLEADEDGVCPRSRGGFQTTWPRIVLTVIVNSGWPSGGITAGKHCDRCSSALLRLFLVNLTKHLSAAFVPSGSWEKVLGLSFICQASQIPCRFPVYVFLVSIFPRPMILLLGSNAY